MYIDFIFHNLKEIGANNAVIWNDQAVSYTSLKRRYDELLKRIEDNQLRPGSVVALSGDYSPESIALLLALIEKECIVVPLKLSSETTNEKLLKIAQAEFELKGDDQAGISVRKLQSRPESEFYEIIRQRRHPGLVLFTSGTSGEPKAAVHDFCFLLKKFKKRRKSLRTLNFLLFDHWGGLNTLFHVLSSGGVVIAPERRNPEIVCKLIEKHKIQLLPVSPSFLNLLILSGVTESYDMSSLEIISYGSEPMPESTLKRLNQLFPSVKLLQTYGLIELGVMHSKSESDDSLWVKIGGDGYQTRVVDGMLQIKAESAMLGYLNADSPFTNDGWFITGDKVLEKGDYLRILGRNSEIINVGGEKVYPQEVESVLQEMGDIADATVYGEKNPLMGQIVCADIKLLDQLDVKKMKSRIKRYCRSHLPAYKVPIKINFVEQVIYSDRFKKMRAAKT